MASARPDSWTTRSRPSSFSGPGRRASLQNQCAVPSDQAKSITTKGNSAADQPSDHTPDSSWGRGQTGKQRIQSFVQQRVTAPESLSADSRTSPIRSQSAGISSRKRMNRRPFSYSAPSRTPLRSAKVQRWEGRTRTVSEWDDLRRDPELWREDGDCFVHLYARGQSRRGASFRVPLKALARQQCHAMFNFCFVHITDTPCSGAHGSSRVIESLNVKIPPTHKVELFIPAPVSATKEEAFEWHLTTRNFFAFVLGKPLVGKQLGQALVDLEERIDVFCSNGDVRKDFLSYIEHQGYRDLVDCPDYALAMLYYAEHYKLRDIWIDAFAHCVGMNEILPLSAEYMSISSLTKALVVRAYLEMDINLGRATAAVREFLAEDVSSTNLGLSDGARAHMDRFRSFLQGFYIEKFGYWPPPKGLTFPKVMFRSMYNDFKSLYDYLVDPESTVDLSSQKPASGGICVLQNLELFDSRHKFPPLPHPLPLLPREPNSKSRIESQRSFRSLSRGSKQNKSDRYMTAHAALTAATNRDNITVTGSGIVQEYQRFERKWALNCQEDKVSMSDARKVRWILIYGTLQYLVSALRAPKEVRDTERPKYPLCCLIVEQSPWQLGTKALTSPRSVSANIQENISNRFSASEDQVAEPSLNIQPDCHREKYFTHTNMDPPSRRMSVEIPAPLKISQLVRNASAGSRRRLSFSSSRNSVQLKAPSHHEIMLHGYGNGLNETTISLPILSTSHTSSKRESMNTSSNFSTPVATAPDDSLWDTKRSQHWETDCNMATQGCQPDTTGGESSNTSSAIIHPLSSSSNSTASNDSQLWSDEASTSSTSSVYSQSDASALSYLTPTICSGNYQDSKVSPCVSRSPPKNFTPSPRKLASASSSIPITYGEFSFGFESNEPASTELHYSSNHDTNAYPSIGVALSGPTPITRIPSLVNRTSRDKPLRSLSAESLNSITTECLRVSAVVGTMSPLRANSSEHLADTPSQGTTGDSKMICGDSSSKARKIIQNEDALERLNGNGPLTTKSNSASMSIETLPVLYPRNAAQLKTVPYNTTKNSQKPTVSMENLKSTSPIKDNEKSFKMFRRRSFWRR